MKATLHKTGAEPPHALRGEAPSAARGVALAVALAMVVAAAVAVPSCGVFSSAGDCAQRADCLDPDEPDVAGPDADAALDAAEGGAAAPDADAGDNDAHEASVDVRCVPTGPEDCTNGVDDDCNGLTDCADLACASMGYACAGAVPSGWLGPVALYEAPASAPAPDCPTGYGSPVDRKGGLAAPPADCTCQCSLSGETCQPAAGQFYSDTSCTTVCDGGTLPIASGTCTSAAPCRGVSVSFKAQPPAWAGTCTPMATRSVAPSSFATAARVCTWASPPDSPGGCAGRAEQCVKSPTGAFGTRFCVYQLGDPPPASCPAGAYTNYHVYYDAVADSRGCATCSCDPPTGGTCTGGVGFFSANDCSGTAGSAFTFGATSCSTLNSPVHAMGAFTPDGGACGNGIGGQATGRADGVRAAAVCCM